MDASFHQNKKLVGGPIPKVTIWSIRCLSNIKCTYCMYNGKENRRLYFNTRRTFRLFFYSIRSTAFCSSIILKCAQNEFVFLLWKNHFRNKLSAALVRLCHTKGSQTTKCKLKMNVLMLLVNELARLLTRNSRN